MSQITLSNCPICQCDDLLQKGPIHDRSISQESFQLSQCQDCGFLFTNPQPSPDDLWKYYESEKYVSHSKTTKGFINFWYRQVQRLNLKLKLKAIHSFVPRGTWLDYGAGAGDFIKYIRNHQLDIIGFEPSKTARTTAKKYGIELRPTTEISRVRKKSIACITLWHVLEHIPNFQEILENLSDLLMSEGILVIAVPNHQSLDAQIYGENWAALDVPRHLWHFSAKDIEAIAKSLSLELLATKAMIFDSTYVSLLSEKYQNGSKMAG
ncbi:MAG TPA: class I SAM-dependent methyltransferase, partial [Cryomorphaceae bacterium]|nr:class I SAM-dependent methyltransferase [Cryomorphaceae bacterium]